MKETGLSGRTGFFCHSSQAPQVQANTDWEMMNRALQELEELSHPVDEKRPVKEQFLALAGYRIAEYLRWLQPGVGERY
jgi:hypothetical protein